LEEVTVRVTSGAEVWRAVAVTRLPTETVCAPTALLATLSTALRRPPLEVAAGRIELEVN